MTLAQEIGSILDDAALNETDKLIEIFKALPNDPGDDEIGEFMGVKGERIGNTIVFDGSKGYDYIDNPKLNKPNDIYYEGCGCTWDTDLNGERYWKLYHPDITRGYYNNLKLGDRIPKTKHY